MRRALVRAAVFTLDTSAMDHWGDFCDMIVAILRTVTFAEPAKQPPVPNGAT